MIMEGGVKIAFSKEEVETYLEYPIEKVDDDDKPVKKYIPYDGPVSMTP